MNKSKLYSGMIKGQVLLVSEFYLTLLHFSSRQNDRINSLFLYKTKQKETKKRFFALLSAGAFFGSQGSLLSSPPGFNTSRLAKGFFSPLL